MIKDVLGSRRKVQLGYIVAPITELPHALTLQRFNHFFIIPGEERCRRTSLTGGP
jgi:hypothetical protein